LLNYDLQLVEGGEYLVGIKMVTKAGMTVLKQV